MARLNPIFQVKNHKFNRFHSTSIETYELSNTDCVKFQHKISIHHASTHELSAFSLKKSRIHHPLKRQTKNLIQKTNNLFECEKYRSICSLTNEIGLQKIRVHSAICDVHC